jgi:hypothetical protein
LLFSSSLGVLAVKIVLSVSLPVNVLKIEA